MTKKQIQVLLDLQNGETVAASRIPQALAGELETDAGVTCVAKGSQRAYKVVSPRAFDVFVKGLGLNPDLLQETIWEMEEPELRAKQVQLLGDSKASAVRSCPGFPVNVVSPMNVMVGERKFYLFPCPGTFLYISDYQDFRIPSNTIVVGVENMENFRLPELQKEVWEQIGPHLLLVSRYPQSKDLVNWLQCIPNPYVHFGDFDLAGIHIYQSEFYKYLGPERASFFVPEDIEERLAKGSRERYSDQFARFGKMPVEDMRLEPLVQLIHRHQKGYDQEGYISFEIF
jgi:hypothetical protein